MVIINFDHNNCSSKIKCEVAKNMFKNINVGFMTWAGYKNIICVCVFNFYRK